MAKNRKTPPANSPIVRKRNPTNRNPSVPRKATFVLYALRNNLNYESGVHTAEESGLECKGAQTERCRMSTITLDHFHVFALGLL